MKTVQGVAAKRRSVHAEVPNKRLASPISGATSRHTEVGVQTTRSVYRVAIGAMVVASVMVLSAFLAVGLGATNPGGTNAPTGPGSVPATRASPTSSIAESNSERGIGLDAAAPSFCSSLETVNNDPGYGAFVHHVQSVAREAGAAGLPGADVHLPYAGPIPDQTVDGVAMAGSQLTAECDLGQPTTSQTSPTGVAYDGQSDVSGVKDLTLDSNSIAGILTVNSPMQNFYPGSATPTTWGAQENVVLTNVTIFGQRCPTAPCAASGMGNYAFWVQNVLSYDSHNDTLSFVDDTWNFTSYSSEMFNSSLVRWSPNGGNYTGTWVAFSPYYQVRPPFTVTLYVNTSVNSAGDQVLWYNYSIQSPGHFIGDGNYDYLVFNSQPSDGRHIKLRPPDFEASATLTHVVTEGYEFDAFIGADDGSNQLMLSANATMEVQYCVRIPYCTPTHFAYANVPAAVNYGSQTGEETIGIAVNYIGSTAYLSGGPLINHGLWNYTAEPGVEPGATRVTNSIAVTGDPEGPLTTQPYVFVFLKDTAYRSEGFQWAPDVPVWFLMPGTYRYEVMLADYAVAQGTLHVGSTPTAFSATLLYDPTMGVYTPLWAFGNGQLAGISSAGNGTLRDQYIPFNNPTTTASGFVPNNLSTKFFSADDYSYPSFTGVLFVGTTAYVDLNSPPPFSVSAYGSTFYLGIEFFETSHVTLSHDASVQGWPAWSEIDFYIEVPASQNPAPQAEVFVWNSTHDLILSNNFVATEPLADYYVAPDALILYGGTGNVVWGNNFSDPAGQSLHVTGPYAGIGLGESGDLIYNNNFSVDNPVVYLPYNWPNVADCLPQTLGGCAHQTGHNGWYYNDAANEVGNTWNVTPQSASHVAKVVNGFRLSGNVLGPRVQTQGGNYYWNYGTAPNRLTTLPYVSRFYYSDWSNIYPLGCGTIVAPGAPCGTAPPITGAYKDGITAGGDYAPYGPMVIFSETGLASGTPWHVTIGGHQYTTTAKSIGIAAPYGAYSYRITSSGWHADPKSGSVLASGIPGVHVVFSRVGHTLNTFEVAQPAMRSRP